MSDKYLKYNQITLGDFSDEIIEEKYSQGFVMTRISKGVMDQTRSLRIDLSKFETTSENRRILRKTDDLKLNIRRLPINEEDYDWKIHKMGKDFYTNKFGDKTFSAVKIRELVTTVHNFNLLFQYSFNDPSFLRRQESSVTSSEALDPCLHRDDTNLGYCISIQTENILHYCYPFYKLDIDTKNIGMGMMLKAIVWANENNKKYIYLGSVQRDTDKYKMQFRGLELWNNDENKWEEVDI